MAAKAKFVLCVNDGGHPESLETRKLYETIEDTKASAEGMIRVIDESGEDYLYPQSNFVELSLPSSITGKLKLA